MFTLTKISIFILVNVFLCVSANKLGFGCLPQPGCPAPGPGQGPGQGPGLPLPFPLPFPLPGFPGFPCPGLPGLPGIPSINNPGGPLIPSGGGLMKVYGKIQFCMNQIYFLLGQLSVGVSYSVAQNVTASIMVQVNIIVSTVQNSINQIQFADYGGLIVITQSCISVLTQTFTLFQQIITTLNIGQYIENCVNLLAIIQISISSISQMFSYAGVQVQSNVAVFLQLFISLAKSVFTKTLVDVYVAISFTFQQITSNSNSCANDVTNQIVGVYADFQVVINVCVQIFIQIFQLIGGSVSSSYSSIANQSCNAIILFIQAISGIATSTSSVTTITTKLSSSLSLLQNLVTALINANGNSGALVVIQCLNTMIEVVSQSSITYKLAVLFFGGGLTSVTTTTCTSIFTIVKSIKTAISIVFSQAYCSC